MKYKYLFGLEREAHIFHNPHTLNNNTPYNSKKTNNNFQAPYVCNVFKRDVYIHI